MKKILYTLGLTVLLASCGSNYLDTVPQSSTGTATMKPLRMPKSQ